MKSLILLMAVVCVGCASGPENELSSEPQKPNQITPESKTTGQKRSSKPISHDQSRHSPISFRNDKVHRRYDRPVMMVTEAVRKAIEHAGVITKHEVSSLDPNAYIVSGRVDTRYVRVEIKPDPQSAANISYVTFRVRKNSSLLLFGRKPDIAMASRLAEDTTLHLIRIVQRTPPAFVVTPPAFIVTNPSVVGTYEAKFFGINARIVLLKNGVVEQYTNDEKKEAKGKWMIVGREIHVVDVGMITVFRINKDGSITYVAGIDNDGKRENYPHSSQSTFKKTTTSLLPQQPH